MSFDNNVEWLIIHLSLHLPHLEGEHRITFRVLAWKYYSCCQIDSHGHILISSEVCIIREIHEGGISYYVSSIIGCAEAQKNG